MARIKSRIFLSLAACTVVGIALSFAFWPRPMMVDIDEVKTGPMIMTIDAEGRTRVQDTYVISTPVAGRLLRVDAEPGDPVFRGESVVAQMTPNNPAALDIRTREQGRAYVSTAEAGLRLARSELNRATADKELADADFARVQSLHKDGTVSRSALDRALREVRAADALLDTAEAAIAMKQAELTNAHAQLISFDDQGIASAIGAGPRDKIAIYAPITGLVLRVIQQSETTLLAGTPIMEIGNIDNDLEVLVELLSTDAVQVSRGDRVLIKDWGRAEVLNATVERVDPWGFTKFSALGVEEQRVNTIIRFADPQPQQAGLGHGFRVEAQIVIWENDNALIVPSSALFRDNQDWAVFVAEDGVARFRQVKISRNNGVQAQVQSGLVNGERVILYPSSGLSEGIRVAQRQIR